MAGTEPLPASQAQVTAAPTVATAGALAVPHIPVPRQRRSRDILVRLVVLAIAGVVVALFATQWSGWVGSATRQVTDDAYIRGDVTPLSSKVDGYVKRVAVDDFQRVQAGEALIEIEDADFRAKVAQAEAEVLGANAAIENIKARKASQHVAITEAEHAIVATEVDVERARLEIARQRELFASTYGTRQRVEQADAEHKRFVAQFAGRQAERDAQRRQLAVLDTQELQLRAETKAKQATLDLAKINLAYTRIAAPVSGVVSERGVREGQYVHSGSQVLSVVPLDNVWVVANYKETQLTNVAVGQRAEIRVDTFPDIVLSATVANIAPASGSQFSLLPPDNATGNFTKVVQRIPVKLKIGADNPLAGHLRPGMSVRATILTDTTPPPP